MNNNNNSYYNYTAQRDSTWLAKWLLNDTNKHTTIYG